MRTRRRELRCRSQRLLGSGVAVAVVQAAAAALVQHLGWDLPNAVGVALKRYNIK